MKKLLTVIFPIAIIFSFTGCYVTDEYHKFLRYPDFKQVSPPFPDGKYYLIKIDGKWYDADSSGNLTEKGKMQKQMDEMMQDDGGGGGGC